MPETAPAPDTAPVPPGAHSYLADERTGRRLGRAAFRYQLGRPIKWVSLVVIVCVFMAAGFGMGQPSQMAVLLAVILIGVNYAQFRSLGRVLGRLYPAGSLHWVTFGPDALTVAGPLGVSEMKFASFRHVWASGTAVIMRSAQSNIIHALPAQLVPPGDLARLRACVGGTR